MTEYKVQWHLGSRVAWRRGLYRFVRVWPFSLSRVPSWDHPRYDRWGFWTNDAGFSLRFRDWVLRFR